MIKRFVFFLLISSPCYAGGLNLISGYVKNSSTLQAGTTFYISSGTVNGQFSVISTGVGASSSTDTLRILMRTNSAGTSTMGWTSTSAGGFRITASTPGVTGSYLQLDDPMQATSPCNSAGGIIANGWCFTSNGLTATAGTGKVGFAPPATTTTNPVWVLPSVDKQGFFQSDGALTMSVSSNIVTSDGLGITYGLTVASATVTSFIGTGIPTISTGTGAGILGTPSASIAGKNLWGQITIVTGTSPATTATIATVTPSISVPTKWVCMLFPANALLSGATMVIVDGTSTTWTVTSGATGLTGASTYVWNYHCGGY